MEFINFKRIHKESVQKALTLEGGGHFDVGPGQITDDSEMAMCLLTAAYDDPQHLNLNKIATYFGQWL